MGMQQKSELPEGWKSVSLGELVQPSKEKIEPSENPNLKYVGLEHIESHKCQIKGYGFSVDIKSTKTMFHRGDVLYGKLRPYLNKVCVPNFDGVCSTDILVFNATSNLNNYYLMRFLSTPNVVDYASNNSSGVQLPRINFQKLSSYTVPLPPLSEQHRIVSAIEALFARLDATNEKLDRVQEILKKFRESVLAAACDGRLTEEWRKENLHCNEYFAIDEDQFNLVKQWRIPTVWSWSTLEDSCSHVVDCPHSTPKWTDIGVYCVRTSELKCGHIDFSNAKYVSEATYLERIKRLKPQEGDILYSREGTVGIASLVPSNVKICLGQRLMLFRTKNNLIPSFFVKVLNSPYIYDSVKKSTMGSTAPRFNVADIKKFPTPLPPLPEQQEIVRRVDALFAFADSIETKVAAAREKTEKLRQSILAKAFSGQLVETQAEIVRREGRDYETAEVLIERIKEERKQ